MYVPYGTAIKDTDSNVQHHGIDQDYCLSSLKDADNLGTLTICDAPGGMARNSQCRNNQSERMPFSNEPFNITSEIKGAVPPPVCATYDLRFFPSVTSSGGPGSKKLTA